MKITTFNPMILSKNADEIIDLFEELGFERCHKVEDVGGMGVSSVQMKDANGFCLDVAQVETMPRDLTTMRMNADDFDEAYELLKAHGFKNSRGEDFSIESKSARSCLMISPSGYSIQLTQHIKDHQ